MGSIINIEAGVLAGGTGEKEDKEKTWRERKVSLSEGLGIGAGKGTKGRGGTILLPTCWDENDRCSLINLSSDGLEVSFAGQS